MKKRLLFTLITLLCLVPAAAAIMQENQQPIVKLELTGVNPTEMPTVLMTTNVFDTSGKPAQGLTIENFTLSGELAESAEIVRVENITDDNLPFASVLVIDTSTSMSGYPLEQAKVAASAFINTLGENDPVAIVTFDTYERLVLDYTTDKDLLLNTINALPLGGVTALYDAGVLAVEVAANASTPRRAVVLLSDGAEYGGASSSLRGDALEQALLSGVSFYTIGLGYGIDRTYLQELSEGTNARSYESPTPDELTQIYTDLAALLRSQYVVTLNMDVPLDGTEYDFTLQAITPEGTSNTISGVVRAPIPVPIVSIENLATEPLAQETTITANVTADDAVTGVSHEFTGGDVPGTSGENAYTLTINPRDLQPGEYTLTITATDENGDTGTATADIEIAALPSEVTFVPDLNGLDINEPVIVTLGVEGQTSTESVSVTLNGETTTLEEPYSFEIDPLALPPGQQTLTIEVVNAGGVTESIPQTFNVTALPADFTIGGIEAGQVFEGSFTSEDVATVEIDVTGSQTDVTEVTYTVGEMTVTQNEAPFMLDLPLLELGTGQKTLEVSVTNAGGVTSTQSVSFSVLVVPTATPTPTATNTPTSTPTPTTDFQATRNVEGTANAISQEGTANAQATADRETTASAQGTLDAQSTLDMESTTSVQGTLDAEATGSALNTQATADAQSTVDAEASAAAAIMQSTADSQATLDVQITLDAQSTLDAESTLQAREELTRQATTDAQSTLDAQATATLDAEATQNLALMLTQTAEEDEQATLNASQSEEEQATMDAQATIDAQDVLDAQSTTDAKATVDAQETIDAQSTQDAESTLVASRSEEEQATMDAQATLDEQATRDVLSTQEQSTADAQNTLTVQQTLNAEETLNAGVINQATSDAQATIDAESTLSEEVALQGTSDAEVITEATQQAQQTLDAAPTQTPTQTMTATAEPTRTPSGPLVEETTDEGQEETTDNTPFLIGGALFLILLVLLFLLFGRRRRK